MHVLDVKRMQPLSDETNPVHGDVVWSSVKSLWFLLHFTLAIWGLIYFASLAAVAVFGLFTIITLCLGHSVGLHRLLIHRSFSAPRWLEYCLVHLGTLVGMGGPFSMLRLHDLRDWAQRHPECHPFFVHQNLIWKDAIWQLHCTVKLKHPPRFTIEDVVFNDPIYRVMQRTWMVQQVPWGVLLYLGGGIGWVLWGISLRIVVSLIGHWLIGYFAHNGGDREYHLAGHAVQGYNLKHLGMLTMGECWHNNHHAFPESAQLGHHPRQHDPGWWSLQMLARLGLVWGLKRPCDLPPRSERHRISPTRQRRSEPAFSPSLQLNTVEETRQQPGCSVKTASPG